MTGIKAICGYCDLTGKNKDCPKCHGTGWYQIELSDMEDFAGKIPSKIIGYKSSVQDKNIAWFLPRPKPDHYKGGMPLYAEEWLLQLAGDILGFEDWKKMRILNLFCGMNKYGLRVDIKSEVKPDVIADAHSFASNDKIIGTFAVILADPPYSDEESKELYGTPKLNYKKWTDECDKKLSDGGLLIVYHKYVMPNPNPDKYEVVKRVFIGSRTYHLPRVATYFRKKVIYETGK